jgi:hypothetical protein
VGPAELQSLERRAQVNEDLYIVNNDALADEVEYIGGDLFVHSNE